MNSNSILLIVDHKHRDLPSLSLIGYYLEKKGFQIYFCGTSMETEVLKEADPKFIIIPKLTYSTYNQLKWKLEGRKLITVETEGNNQDKEIKLRAIVYPDLYFFWNDSVKNIYEKDFVRHDTEIIVGGYYRSDFFSEPLSKIFNPVEIKRSIGIYNQLPTITIATSTQDSHFNPERVKNKKKKRKRSFDLTPDYELIIKNMRILRDITENFLINVNSEIKEEVNFVIKPHPNESVIYWHDLIKKNKIKNCYLMLGKNINQLLSISDYHISHNVCTTTAEAIMSNIMTVEIQTKFCDKLYAKTHLDLADQIAKSENDLYRILNNFIKNNTKNKNIKIKDYISSFFSIYDGNRCKSYAEKIENFIINGNYKKLSLKLKIKYSLLLLLINLKNIIMFRSVAKNKKVVIDHINPNQDDKRIINGFNVHKEYGLYDNKIKADDHIFWYKKFKELGV